MNIWLTPRLRLVVGLVCALAAIVVYAPAQFLPFIGDDYIQIHLGRRFASPEGWASLAGDALYRCRATSLFLTRWTELLFGVHRIAFNLSSLAIHILNCLLVLGLGSWRLVGYRISLIAAIFFAFLEGHHEAVIWYAALPELLVFTFCLVSFLFWLRWLQSPAPKAAHWLMAFAAFLLALASKESAVCLVGLMALSIALAEQRTRNQWLAVVPFGLVSVVYFAQIYGARAQHLHFNDGTFSLYAPFWITLTNTTPRMLWPWGLIALLTSAALKRLPLRFASMLLGWTLITLLPYSFLTYMPRVPSRHTYFASVALALLVASGFIGMWRWTLARGPGWRLAVVCVALICFAHNTIYLWTRKQQQFRERASATQSLIRAARASAGPIVVECFPHQDHLALLAVAIEVPGAESRLVLTRPNGCKPMASSE